MTTPGPNDILVCNLKGGGHFADDVAARCAHCGAEIVHRPHAAAIPTKVCLPCGLAHMAAHPPTTVVAATRETMAEVALYLRRTDGCA